MALPLMVGGIAFAMLAAYMQSLLRRYNRTTMLMVGCAAFLLGLVLAHRQVAVSGWITVPGMVAAVVALGRRTLLAVGVVAGAGMMLGIWRGGAYLHELRPYQTLAHQKVVFTATANIDAVYGASSQLSFVVRDVHVVSPRNVQVPGTIKVSGFGATMVYRGDRLQVSGKLYPTRGASQATVSFAQVAKIGGASSIIDAARRKFTAGMQSALPEPLASFGLGLLVGQRNTLPAALSQALLMVGLTHIIAVSGYNLTILLNAARRLLGKRSKVLSTALALTLIAGFLLVAGTSASIVRAAVISVLTLAAWYYGRSVRPLLLVLLAAAGTAYANPMYLWADVSWYLSFLAFFGILVLGPAITRRLFGEKQPALLLQIVIESLCAELTTLPIILYIFGQMSLVSLLANMLVVALIPLAMLLSLVAGLAGMLAGSICGWLSWPAQVLLTYMLDVVTMLSRIPHVFQQNRYISAAEMAVWYVALTVCLVVLQRKQRRETVSILQIQKVSHRLKELAINTK